MNWNNLPGNKEDLAWAKRVGADSPCICRLNWRKGDGKEQCIAECLAVATAGATHCPNCQRRGCRSKIKSRGTSRTSQEHRSQPTEPSGQFPERPKVYPPAPPSAVILGTELLDSNAREQLSRALQQRHPNFPARRWLQNWLKHESEVPKGLRWEIESGDNMYNLLWHIPGTSFRDNYWVSNQGNKRENGAGSSKLNKKPQ
ncbi:hypothetical protein QBC35DRAFT_457400 [Podospora australis]|uniref:Uncharacterized protein n=1 Tax=Podospora australis TaxID=1536484 RepID=A0AAN7ADY9_9PEZI|nr:hypothetical protein QBC35DRAFT_457400 [Podospora australis]